MSPEVSIIVLCHDRWETTRRCLDSVRRFTEAGLYELLAYDNASADSTPAGLKRLASGWPRLRARRNEKNLSFAEANNRGMRAARGRHFLWLNNDTVVGPGWLEGLLAAARSSEGVAAAGPMTDHQAPPGQISRPFATRPDGRVADTPFLGGFCLLLKREAVERAGLLDERFTWGWEDMDYCMRLRQAGRRLVVARDVFVAHAGSRTLAGLPTPERERQDRANRRLILGKWLDSPTRRSKRGRSPRFELPMLAGAIGAIGRDLQDLYRALPAPWHRLSPKASILLACREWPRARLALESLRRSGGLEDCEVLAVNVSGEPGLSRRLEEAGKGWKEYRALGPWSSTCPAAALNRAVALAGGDHLGVFDEGARFERGWLDAALRTAGSRPDAGAVRPARDPRSGWLAPRPVFERLGGFDERFRGTAFCPDFLLRVRQAGLTVVIAEGCRVLFATKAGPGDLELADRRLAQKKWGGLADEVCEAPELSTLILCRGSWAGARKRLEAASRAAGETDHELLAVYLDPPVGGWERLKTFADRHARVRPLGPWGERSAAAAFNRAARLARGGRLAFVSADTRAPALETSRAGFNALGGFDERFSGSGCFEDYRLRAAQAGAPLGVASPNAEPARLEDRRLAAAKWLDPGIRERFRKGPKPEASVIVLCAGPMERTRRRLEALRRACGQADYEALAVVLGAPRPDARLAGLADAWPRLRVLGPWPDRAGATAFNRAASHAHADRLAFLDDRADPAPGWLDRLLRTHAGVVRTAGQLSGFAVSRELFERLGGFDERFSGELCGWDLWMRALQAGSTVIEAEGARVAASMRPCAFEDRGLAAKKWIEFRRQGPASRLWEAAGLRLPVSVIVLCRGHWGETQERLAALRGALGDATDHEVLAGAFSAPPETARGLGALAERWPRLRFIGEWPPTPYAHALNLASEAALGEKLLFLKDDAEVRPGFLEALLATADKAASPGVVAPGYGAPRDLGEHCVLIPSQVFALLGGFDHRFEKDLWARDFCLRALQRGFGLGAVDPALARRTSTNGAAAPRAHDRGLLFGKWSGHPLFEAAR